MATRTKEVHRRLSKHAPESVKKLARLARNRQRSKSMVALLDEHNRWVSAKENLGLKGLGSDRKMAKYFLDIWTRQLEQQHQGKEEDQIQTLVRAKDDETIILYSPAVVHGAGSIHKHGEEQISDIETIEVEQSDDSSSAGSDMEYEESGEASKAFRKKKQPAKRGLKQSLPHAIHDGAERVTVDLTPGITPIKEENADGGNKPMLVKITKVTTDTGDIVSVPIYTKQLENTRGVKLHGIFNEPASFKTSKPANVPIPEEQADSCWDTDIAENPLAKEITDNALDKEITDNPLDRKIKTESQDPVTDTMQLNVGSRNNVKKFINIGEQLSRWNELKAALGIDIHDNMANYLLSLYDAVKYQEDECPKLVQDCLNRESETSQDTEDEDTSEDISSDESVLFHDDVKDLDWQPSDEDDEKSTKKDTLPTDDHDGKSRNNEKLLTHEEGSEEKKEDTEKVEQVKKVQRFTFVKDDTKRVKCNKCDEVMAKSEANTHWKFEHAINMEPCPLCHCKTRNMYIHYRKKHVQIWRQEKEELLARSRQRVLEEIHEKEKEKTMCHLCGISWEGILARTNVTKHIREVHADKYSTCPIEGCGKRVKAVMMSSHKRGHRKEHLCTQCGYAFRNKYKLQEHVKVIHLQIRDQPCTWPGCKKAFKTKKHLTIHLRIHTDDKPLQCDKCEYSCRQRAAMNWHVQKHHGVILPNRTINTSFKLGRPRKKKEISATQTLNEDNSDF